MHAARPARFLLTLPLVEPQHTAPKHRHGRGHEEGEGGRRSMGCGGRSHKRENRTERGARQRLRGGWGGFSVGSEQKENKNR